MRGRPALESDAEGVEADHERELEELARAGAPLRRVLCALAGRLVARRAFEPLDYARLGDYARERLGVSARSLQEWARVDAKLQSLPQLDAALVSGRLAWSKVRLLARFVTREDEAQFIARAAGASVKTLERELRAVERGARGASSSATTQTEAELEMEVEVETDEEGVPREPVERIAIHATPPLAFKWQRTCRAAAQVAGETTLPASVLEWVSAEAVAGLSLPDLASDAVAEDDTDGEPLDPQPALQPTQEAEEAGESEEAEKAETDEAGGATNVCATHSDSDGTPAQHAPGGASLPPFLRPLLEGVAEADPFTLDARLQRAIRLEQRLNAEIAARLRVVTGAEFEWRTRYRSLDELARESLGMSPTKARSLRRLEVLCDRAPELRQAYRDGALSWVQAQALARLVASGEAENASLPAWVQWAQGVSVRRLEETVQRALLWRQTDPEGRLPEDPETIAAAVGDEPPQHQSADPEGRQTCARPTGLGGSVRILVTAPSSVAQLFHRALCCVRLALERETGHLPSEAEAFEAMLDHALQSWGVEDRWLRSRSRSQNAIFARDGWRCTVPGCTSRRNLQRHHIVFRSQGGSDAPENQTTLCAFHHHRGVHEGRLRIRGTAPDRLWFELGVRAGRPPLLRYRSGDRLAFASPSSANTPARSDSEAAGSGTAMSNWRRSPHSESPWGMLE